MTPSGSLRGYSLPKSRSRTAHEHGQRFTPTSTRRRSLSVPLSIMRLRHVAESGQLGD